MLCDVCIFSFWNSNTKFSKVDTLDWCGVQVSEASAGNPVLHGGVSGRGPAVLLLILLPANVSEAAASDPHTQDLKKQKQKQKSYLVPVPVTVCGRPYFCMFWQVLEIRTGQDLLSGIIGFTVVFLCC